MLHNVRGAENLQRQLEAGADPNERDGDGRTPLMQERSGEDVIVLLGAGADPNARDAQGRSVLEYVAGQCAGSIGYCAPDFDALDLLLEAGAIPPTQAQGERWIEHAHRQVCAAGEHNDALRFAAWVQRVAREGKDGCLN